ncbi:MAG: hypothetical protein HYV96_06640 [Opitutae bacterium]|nr:hypothetical protein [Opitutae bacterium]
MLGVGPDVTAASLERAQVQRSFALIRSGTPEQKAELLAAYEALAAELRRRAAARGEVARDLRARDDVVGAAPSHPRPEVADHRAAEAPAVQAARGAPAYVPPAADVRATWLNPLSFDSWAVNAFALPLLLALAWAANASPLGFFLRGFQVWMHEFGHATVAWLSGYRALPLPIGWTNVEAERAPFVYFGVLFLLGALAWAGWRERKIWAILLPLALVPVQFYMTWRMPEHRGELWLAFGGVGGEFYLSAALMALFFVHLPEKFRWGICRYVFAFLGASTLLNVWLRWRKIARFEETIPYGSMIGGEEDGGGDMNVLRAHGWRETQIVHVYTSLGFWCLVALAIVWLIFATRLDRAIGNLFARIWPE